MFYKFLIPIAAIGAATGGGYFAIKSLGKSDEKNNHKLKKEVSRKESSRKTKIKSSKKLVNVYSTKPDISSTKKVEEDTTRKLEVIEFSKSQEDKNKEFILKVDNSPEIKVQEENLNPIEQEIQEESEEELKKKFDVEIDEKQILLEAVWGRRHGWVETQDKTCFLLKKGENKLKDLPDMGAEEEDEDENEEACYGDETTLWTQKMNLKIEEAQGFWIRGENELVRKMISTNWENLIKGSSFEGESLKEGDNDFEISKKLGSSCIINSKNDKNWVEISCTEKATSKNF